MCVSTCLHAPGGKKQYPNPDTTAGDDQFAHTFVIQIYATTHCNDFLLGISISETIYTLSFTHAAHRNLGRVQ